MKLKKASKILSLALSATLLLSTVAACGDEVPTGGVVDNSVALPAKLDYSGSTKDFSYFAYSSLYDGTFTEGDTVYETGLDFINEYYIQEFYDSGCGTLMPQTTALGVSAEAYPTSTLKKVLDIAEKLGKYKSVVITDNSIYSPFNNAESTFPAPTTLEANREEDKNWQQVTLYGDDYSWQYENEEALVDFLVERMSTYCYHPAFEGVMLPDEPDGYHLNAYGQLYRAVRKAAEELGLEDMTINANLFPHSPKFQNVRFPAVETDFVDTNYPGHNLTEAEVGDQMGHEQVRRYYERFLETSGADELQFDVYPIDDYGIYQVYFLNLQIAAQVAKEHDAKIIVVSQTMTMNGTRRMSFEDLSYMNNAIMGFGGKNIGYFTYFTHEDSGGDIFDDMGSMVTRFGDKTDIYYRVQRINAQSRAIAPVILNFDYVTNAYYVTDTESNPISFRSDQMELPMSYLGTASLSPFTKLKKVKLNREMGIVTELYDDEKGNYMYMVMNTIDTQYFGVKSYETFDLTFASEYDHAWVYYNGHFNVYKLDKNHGLRLSVNPGEAHFVIPFKA